MAEEAEPSDTTKVDNWDDHWTSFGDPALSNPANDYRNRLILKHLGHPEAGTTVVDIGSGQGQLALLLQETFPSANILGIEYSHEGVHRAREAAASGGLSARFVQRDLLQSMPIEELGSDAHRAPLAVCSEVLEHVDEPELLLRNAADYLLPGCKLIVTVPGGPRSALDRHIGHRRHFRPETIRAVLQAADFSLEGVYRAGFPFFDLYRLAVIARGERLIEDLKSGDSSPSVSTAQKWITRFFDASFRANLDHSPFGWQIVATARYEPSTSPATA